jgi:hypothetical protein
VRHSRTWRQISLRDAPHASRYLPRLAYGRYQTWSASRRLSRVGNLLNELSRLSDTDTPLDRRLERVRISAEAIWELPRLPWFTDHRANRHSRRLIELLGQMTDALQRTDRALNRAEIFILLASCYLHDIGMQDITIDGKGWDELSVEDYEVIRKRHPERGKQLIVQGSLSPERGSLRVDLDDLPEYLQPIALVSQGHGSAFHEATVRELEEKIWAPDGKRIRGALLAALLLVADELDVASDRTSFPRGGHLSPISALHHFLNHYVTDTAVRPGSTSKRRQVEIAFEFPPDSDDYRPDVRRVLVDKICAQARRTNPTVERATDGELLFEPAVVVVEQTDTLGVRRQIDGEALMRLRTELRRADLVGREEIMATFNAALRSVSGVAVISLLSPEDSDLDAVSRWISAETVAGGGRYLELSFQPQVGRDAVSVLAELGGWAGIKEEDVNGATGITALAEVVGHALADQGPGRPVILFREVEAADRNSIEAIEQIIATLKSDGGGAAILLSHDGSVTPEADEYAALNPLDGAMLTQHLRNEFGYAHREAEIFADELVGLADGRAGPIVALLAVRRLSHQTIG